ncbi:MAG: hypothetical protein C7B47_11840 [Sulfobacillus thermosulfidooxidans]|uniref:Uncharacterized protein n=1 Tax=Sulfobacillus thermosulfidooxidans TaxID=28034 RepID=A0A2T2WTQ7_SULTH|nr:MAG: hypothetical protein C7B47_11840 [Sulfobacillus thermosulfidooxidans]
MSVTLTGHLSDPLRHRMRPPINSLGLHPLDIHGEFGIDSTFVEFKNFITLVHQPIFCRRCSILPIIWLFSYLLLHYWPWPWIFGLAKTILHFLHLPALNWSESVRWALPSVMMYILWHSVGLSVWSTQSPIASETSIRRILGTHAVH